MKRKEFLRNFNFKNEAEYEIVVQGELGAEWSSRLSNMKIVIEKENNEKAYSFLTGEIADQATLSGVLNTLYDLRMTVISVNLISK